MAQMRTVADVFPPGEFLRDELEAREWTQSDLADIMGRHTEQTVSEIITGKKEITPETAKEIAAALETSAELWLNLESAYQLSRVKRDPTDVARRGKLYRKAPIKEMMRRHWIRECDTIDGLENELLKFFEIPCIDDAPQLSFASRKGTDYNKTTPSQLAWLCRAKKLGRAVHASKFKQNVFEKWLGQQLRNLIGSEFEIRRVPKLLADVGVRLVIVEHLAKTRIDGAVLWLDADTPIVALSLRYGRIDHFWWTLCHELSHVRHHDSISLDSDLVGESPEPTLDKPEFEQRADKEAGEMLIDQQELDNFIRRTKPLYSKVRINQFANRLQTHPGIIVGQLQRRKEIGYGHSRETLVSVREIILPAALADGWGHTAPVL